MRSIGVVNICIFLPFYRKKEISQMFQCHFINFFNFIMKHFFGQRVAFLLTKTNMFRFDANLRLLCLKSTVTGSIVVFIIHATCCSQINLNQNTGKWKLKIFSLNLEICSRELNECCHFVLLYLVSFLI